MFQSYIKIIFSYLKLSYFILNLCIAEQLFTPHFSVVAIFHTFMDKTITKTWMVSWLFKRVGFAEGWLCKAMWCRIGQGRACKCKPGLTYIAVLQKRLTVWEILKFHVLALSKMSTYCVSWHPKNAWCIIRRKSAR